MKEPYYLEYVKPKTKETDTLFLPTKVLVIAHCKRIERDGGRVIKVDHWTRFNDENGRYTRLVNYHWVKNQLVPMAGTNL